MDAPQGRRCGLAGRPAVYNSCAANEPWRSCRRLKSTGRETRNERPDVVETVIVLTDEGLLCTDWLLGLTKKEPVADNRTAFPGELFDLRASASRVRRVTDCEDGLRLRYRATCVGMVAELGLGDNCSIAGPETPL